MEDVEDLGELLCDLDQFPTIPDLALRIIRALEDPEVDLDQVAEWIEREPVLAARVVRLARSPMFGALGPDGSLRRAILLLGTSETRRVVLSVAIMNCLPELPAPLSVVSFWTLGLGTALAARHLAQDLKYGNPEWAYLAGLVHSLGEAYLAVRFTPRYQQAIEHALERRAPFETTIAQEFGINHPSICAEILRCWSFPEAIAEAVEFHLEPDCAPNQRSLASLVFVADRVCRDLGLGPVDPSHVPRIWVDEIPADLFERIEGLGYPDVEIYLQEQADVLSGVTELARSLFSAAS